ncbi:unnamed protein product [Rotaria sp. Silwood1]|nr:unnamed protein product [Rotaria sp. Silwood1]CAF3885772.1 unnamed protein product [Rotaria sp. Silwood1]CAF4715960.1 unnamed protein product [Rotaria sp. Silwood1]CAF4747334.1 unnamed protein product [Rotaria sp. Silwood1]
MLNAGRRIRAFEKQLKRLKFSKTTTKATKLDHLNDESKARIASYEDKLDTIIWYYEDLQCIKLDAEVQLHKIKLPLESPIAFIGDASGSMEVVIRTATILSLILTAVYSAKLNLFNTDMLLPTFTLKTIEDVLTLALTTKATDRTANVAGLVSYYDGKEVIKTFIIVTDELENTETQLADGTSIQFFDLFMKCRAEFYPAKLGFISFISNQHSQGQMSTEFQDAYVPDVIQFKFSRDRLDLTKLDNLLGLLSTGSLGTFDDQLEKLQNEFQEKGVESVITNLFNKQTENSIPMATEITTK